MNRPMSANPVLLALVAAALGGCAKSDPRAADDPGIDGAGGSDDGQGTGGDGMQSGDGDGDDTSGGDGDMAQLDASVSCRPNPEADPACPEICPETCNDVDDDCDGVVDEDADDTDCAADQATGICTGGRCILTGCDDGFRDCDGAQQNGCEVDITSIEDCGACGNRCEFDNTAAACVDGACEPGECAEPYLDCTGDDGVCETFAETLTDCGSCGQMCGAPDRATPACVAGACGIDECLGNFGDCNGDVDDGCELPLNTPAHCGGCGVPCAFAGSSTSCDEGVCIIMGCSPGFADCDGSPLTACDSLDTEQDCGGCGQACSVASLEHVSAATCDSRSCEVTCAAGFGDCDGVANGCETPLTGVNNCAGCAVACDPDHAVGNCDDGSCQVAVCDSGWADCDNDPANGCETDTGRPENCGGCNIQCQVSPPIGCNGATCAGVLCPEGEADCDGDDMCEATLSDDATCGSCNVACEFDNNVDGHGSIGCAVENSTPGQMAWGCEVTCMDGFADCDGDYRNGCEADLTDLDTCGSCGNVCTKSHATPTCDNRVCEVATCDLDWGDCNGDGVDCETQLNSATNCGACGTDCDLPFAAALCGGSPGSRQCAISACLPVEYADCDLLPGSGCEVDTTTDSQHCNGCGNDCTAANNVVGAACVDSACAYTCETGFDDCDPGGGCETNLLQPSSCGACTTDCFALPQVDTATCLPGGGNPVCAVDACDVGYGDCNGAVGDGCEVDTGTSDVDCGACAGELGNEPCTGLTGVSTSVCVAGICRIQVCDGGLVDCNGLTADGCEWDPAQVGECCDPNDDMDSDGVSDCDDLCPTDPGKGEPGVCGCFVPDSDRDGDAALDCIDACPDDPSKTDDADTDADGRPDCVDVCPLDPTDNASPRAMTSSPGTCTWATHCSHGYWFCTNNRDFDQARPLCQAIGGDLLSINNQPEQDFARVYATGGNQWIVGLNQINLSGSNAAGVWEWIDGTLAMGGFENWRNGEPDNSDCGAIDSGLWIDWNCGNAENWICEVP